MFPINDRSVSVFVGNLRGITLAVNFVFVQKSKPTVVGTTSGDARDEEGEPDGVAWWEDVDRVRKLRELPRRQSFKVQVLDGEAAPKRIAFLSTSTQELVLEELLDVFGKDFRVIEVDRDGFDFQWVRDGNAKFFVTVVQRVPQAFRGFVDETLEDARLQISCWKTTPLFRRFPPF